MLDDIDYSALQPSVEEAPKKKAGVSSRSVTKQESVARKPVDAQAVAQKAESISEGLGAPTIEDPISQYGLPAAGILAGLAAAYGMYQRAKANTSFTAEKAPELSVPSDQKGVKAIESLDQNIAQTQPSPMDVLRQRKEQIKAAGLGVQPPAVPSGPTYNVPTSNIPAVPPVMQAGAPAAPVQAPMAATPIAQSPAPVTEAIATGQSPSKAIQMDVAQQLDSAPSAPESGIKKRAAKTQQTFKSEAAIPPGTTFRGDIGNLDRSLFNVLGPEHRRNAMELLNSGKPFGNVQDVNAAVKDITSRYWQAVQSQIPETLLGREERAAQGLKSEFGNYGALGKAAKVAGVAGTLLSVADLAKAAQQAKEGQYGEAAKTAIPAIDPTGIGTAAVQPQGTAQMLTNISPIMGLLSQIIGAQTQGKKAVSR